MRTPVSLFARIHEKCVFERRVRVLAGHLAALMPEGGRVLDVGCGDGSIAAALIEARPDVTIEGVDIMVRPETKMPVNEFDGQRLPFEDNSFDTVMFVDLLHHTDDPAILLAEARRVARHSIVLKDHCRDGVLAGATLRFMDWVGNAHHGVVLPYNYWEESRWQQTFGNLAVTVDSWQAQLALYPFPANLLFDRKLHFVARLRV